MKERLHGTKDRPSFAKSLQEFFYSLWCQSQSREFDALLDLALLRSHFQECGFVDQSRNRENMITARRSDERVKTT